MPKAEYFHLDPWRALLAAPHGPPSVIRLNIGGEKEEFCYVLRQERCSRCMILRYNVTFGQREAVTSQSCTSRIRLVIKTLLDSLSTDILDLIL